MRKAISTILAASLLMGTVCSCNLKPDTENPNALDPSKIVRTGEPVSVTINELSSESSEKYRQAYINTSFELLKKQLNGNKNVMISPASILLALSMTEAGAGGDTLKQMAALWGGEDDYNAQLSYAADILKKLNNSQGVSMHAADSVWINDSLLQGKVKAEFVDFVKQYYDAEVQNLVFDDQALNKLNDWVKEHTDGMISKILDRFEPSTAMVLINAIAFDGKWADQYEEYQVQDGKFRNAQGQEIDVKMLNGSERNYLENGKATGFIKYYEGRQYGFVVMLPKDEKQSADDMLREFTGDDFDALLNSKTGEYTVYTQMPEFSYDYSSTLNDSLKDLGMKTAFDQNNADFRGIAEFDDDKNLYISKVIHKTHIEVSRTGTRAAAVTAVRMDAAGACIEEDIKSVTCDRPFAYAIVDLNDNTPVFIGTVNDITGEAEKGTGD